MRKTKYGLLIYPLAMLMAIFVGCASSDTKKEKEQATPENNQEQVDKVEISEFILGAGDTIEINVYRQDDLKGSFKINRSGKIMFPLIGDVQVGSKSIFQVRDEIREKLSKYLVDPQITINVTTVQSQKIMVLGEVKNPGIYTLDTDFNVVEAIAKAGGVSDDANSKQVILARRGKDKYEFGSINLKKIYKGNEISSNKLLQSGDIIYVPKVAIANVSWFFNHLKTIISPVVDIEKGIVLWPQVKDVLRGEEPATAPIIAP
jgi:polysaccharide export outer membrane protein